MNKQKRIEREHAREMITKLDYVCTNEDCILVIGELDYYLAEPKLYKAKDPNNEEIYMCTVSGAVSFENTTFETELLLSIESVVEIVNKSHCVIFQHIQPATQFSAKS